MGPRTYVSFSNDPDAKSPDTVLVSPCCDAPMDETDGTCPTCKEPCDPVEGENDGDPYPEETRGDELYHEMRERDAEAQAMRERGQ